MIRDAYLASGCAAVLWNALMLVRGDSYKCSTSVCHCHGQCPASLVSGVWHSPSTMFVLVPIVHLSSDHVS